MTCSYSREILALYVEDDLSADAAAKVESHVARCAECREYSDQLRRSQSFIKSRFEWNRQEPINQQTLTRMRQSVMSQIDGIQQTRGWALRLERFLMLGLRKHRYVAAGFAVLVILSATLLAQIRHSTQTGAAAVFVDSNKLVRPADYRDWVSVGSSLEHSVYIDPAAYSEYTHTGRFPDGTVLVLEMGSGEEKQGSGLQVSVKDASRFEAGWGFYEFNDATVKSGAEPMPQTAGCLACHRDKAATDHVFTQFYSALRNIRG